MINKSKFESMTCPVAVQEDESFPFFVLESTVCLSNRIEGPFRKGLRPFRTPFWPGPIVASQSILQRENRVLQRDDSQSILQRDDSPLKGLTGNVYFQIVT